MENGERPWVVFRWGELFLRTREPERRDALVEWLDRRVWRPSELVAAVLEAVEAERLGDEEIRTLDLPA